MLQQTSPSAMTPDAPKQKGKTLAEILTEQTGWDGSPSSPLLKKWESLTKLRQQHHIAANSETDAVELARRNGILAAAVDSMENPQMMKEHVRMVYSSERTAVRLVTIPEQIAALEKVMAVGADAVIHISPDCNRMIREAFLDDKNGEAPRHEAARLVQKVREYALDYYKSHSRLSPLDRIDEIKVLLLQPYAAQNPEKWDSLRNELTFLEGQDGQISSGARIVAENENARLVGASQIIKDGIASLAFAIASVLRVYLATAIQDETDFFKAAGLPWEETSKSRPFRAMIKEMEDVQMRITKPDQHAHSFPLHPSNIQLFGVEWMPGPDAEKLAAQ